MKTVATFSILLALAVMLLPWQICDCGEDGPHLKPLWDSAHCDPADAPAPVEAAGERSDTSEDGCGGLFQFVGSLASTVQDLPTPSEGEALALRTALMSATWLVRPVSTSTLLIWPSSDPQPGFPVLLAARLLL